MCNPKKEGGIASRGGTRRCAGAVRLHRWAAIVPRTSNPRRQTTDLLCVDIEFVLQMGRGLRPQLRLENDPQFANAHFHQSHPLQSASRALDGFVPKGRGSFLVCEE